MWLALLLQVKNPSLPQSSSWVHGRKPHSVASIKRLLESIHSRRESEQHLLFIMKTLMYSTL